MKTGLQFEQAFNASVLDGSPIGRDGDHEFHGKHHNAETVRDNGIRGHCRVPSMQYDS
jgi:hypothetical protein